MVGGGTNERSTRAIVVARLLLCLLGAAGSCTTLPSVALNLPLIVNPGRAHAGHVSQVSQLAETLDTFDRWKHSEHGPICRPSPKYEEPLRVPRGFAVTFINHKLSTGRRDMMLHHWERFFKHVWFFQTPSISLDSHGNLLDTLPRNVHNNCKEIGEPQRGSTSNLPYQCYRTTLQELAGPEANAEQVLLTLSTLHAFNTARQNGAKYLMVMLDDTSSYLVPFWTLSLDELLRRAEASIEGIDGPKSEWRGLMRLGYNAKNDILKETAVYELPWPFFPPGSVGVEDLQLNFATIYTAGFMDDALNRFGVSTKGQAQNLLLEMELDKGFISETLTAKKLHHHLVAYPPLVVRNDFAGNLWPVFLSSPREDGYQDWERTVDIAALLKLPNAKKYHLLSDRLVRTAVNFHKMFCEFTNLAENMDGESTNMQLTFDEIVESIRMNLVKYDRKWILNPTIGMFTVCAQLDFQRHTLFDFDGP